jgi:hypothetical protein
MKVCRMGAENEHGVLLWVRVQFELEKKTDLSQAEPRHPHRDPKRDVHFNITVALPMPGVRKYKDLTTDLALFSHSVGDFLDMWSQNSFEVVRLKTSNAPINHGVCRHIYFCCLTLQQQGGSSSNQKVANLRFGSNHGSNLPIGF